MDVSYSPEYRTTGVNLTFLRSLAAAGGGSVITRPGDAWSSNLPPVEAQYDIAPWLLLLAILLLPVDIGVRRLVVSRRELASIAAALPFRHTRSSTAEPATPLLGALRARRAQRDALAPQITAHESDGLALPTTIAPNRRRGSGARIGGQPSGARSIGQSSNRRRATARIDGEESIGSRLLAARRKRE
jgi:hypothetical protein